MRFAGPPPMTISQQKRYVATMVTSDGTFSIELLPRLAPVTVNNFVFLARHHFYNNILFHRIISTFMIQTGDPTGTGEGGPGYEFQDEIRAGLHPRYVPGTVAMANSGAPNTNGSQFFIVTGPDGASLPYKFTIFGFVSHGLNVVEKIAQTPVGYNQALNETSEPLTKVYLRRVIIRVLPPLHRGGTAHPKH